MNIFKKITALFLVIFFVFSLCSLVPQAADETKLRFNSDGKFKILVFADCQDDNSPHQKMIDLISYSLDAEQPDFVVFTGDNIVVGTENNFRTAAQKIIQPLIDRNIPYAYTFGNHDNERGLSKDFMHEAYMSLGTCMTYDADPSLNGFGNCNIPVYSSTGNDIAFNLWMIDSLTYADGGYDHVREDQLEWYKQTSIALEKQVGHKVNSIMFQHIAMPEIYNLLTESSTGSKTYMGKRYSLNLNSNATGYLGEFPCPPAVNGGQFDALVERGDVLGVVSGHDHSNAFHGKYNGIGFIQMPGMSFESYGDDNCRGYGVIELDESNTSTYSTHTVSYTDFWNGKFSTDFWNNTGYFGSATPEYVSSIGVSAAVTASSAKNTITNGGFTLIDKDLNVGAGGQFVYMGYKTTTEHTKALRDIKFYVADSNSAQSSITCTVNGKECTYTQLSTIDLNKGAGGDYIYVYGSYDENAGPPIKTISFGSTTTTSYKVCGTLISSKIPADLNANAGGEYIYCYLDLLEPLDISELFESIEDAQILLENSEFYGNSDAVLVSTLDTAMRIKNELQETGITTVDQDYIDKLCVELTNARSYLICEVKFLDYDGSVVESLYVPYGASAECSIVPQRPSDEQYNYMFTGWDIDTSVVDSCMIVNALYEAEHYHSSEVPATCTENEVCKFCGEILALATGHGKTTAANIIEATCTKEGYTGDVCCVDCGMILVAGESIPAKDHSYGDWVYYTLPTVTKNGVDRTTCSICKTTVYRDTPKATTATVSDEFIYGFRANLSPNDVNSYFDLRYLSVGKQAYNGKAMGTNSVISVTQKNVTTNYTVVIFGDVNGDGWYDGQDAVVVSCLADGILTKENVSEAEYMAADCNHDGVVDSFDVELLNRAGALVTSVDQSKTDIELQTNSVYGEYIDLIEQSPEIDEPTHNPETEEKADMFAIIFDFIKKIIETVLSYIGVK